MGFDRERETYIQLIESALRDALPEPSAEWPQKGIPINLNDAMRYSLLAGGKRLRPMLLLAAYRLLEDDLVPALPFACAIEMIHTYSLIHDDLPSMDNDSMRRGKPTNHKVFGEAVAILSGDALLNMAYEIMAKSNHPLAIKALSMIAEAAGASGMIAGQSADIWMEGKLPDEGMLHYIHEHKTADLITAPVKAGLLLAGADLHQIQAGTAYGYHLGLAFQIMDDLLDELGDEEAMGKKLRKDEAAGKLTWPGLYGIDRTRDGAHEQTILAVNALEPFGRRGEFLRWLAQSNLHRAA